MHECVAPLPEPDGKRGPNPTKHKLLDCRLSATSKPGSGIGPIVIGNVWVCIAGHCTLAANPKAGLALQPLQIGVSVSRGFECTGHAPRVALAEKLAWQLNEFIQHQAAAEHLPGLFAFAH
jgi:hypothetical protein